jgi:hypothetical protein
MLRDMKWSGRRGGEIGSRMECTEFTEQGDLVRLRETRSMVNPEN